MKRRASNIRLLNEQSETTINVMNAGKTLGEAVGADSENCYRKAACVTEQPTELLMLDQKVQAERARPFEHPQGGPGTLRTPLPSERASCENENFEHPVGATTWYDVIATSRGNDCSKHSLRSQHALWWIAVRTPAGVTTRYIRMQRFSLGCRHLV